MLQLFKKYLIYFCLTVAIAIDAIEVIAQERPIQISVSANYIKEDFQWSIAGNIQGESPNVLSELIWKNLQGPGLKVGVNWKVWKRIVLQAQVNRSVITKGSATDTDYDKDNRTSPLVQVNAKSNKGHIDMATLGVGYQLITHKKFGLTTYFGYGINRQSLYLLDTFDATDKPIERLNSAYATTWKGFFFRVTPQISVSKNIELKNSLTYYQVAYHGEANWNLITGFQHPLSFEHKANGYGVSEQLELSMKVTPILSIKLSGNYDYWETGAGIDQLYLSNGNTTRTKFNQAVRKGGGLAAGINLDL